jgi:flagellar hook-associated protein 1
MGLTGVLSTARFALESAAAQTALVSRNIAGASDPAYSRKITEAPAFQPGMERAEVRRAANPQLAGDTNAAHSSSSTATAMQEGIDRLRALLGGEQGEGGPSMALNALKNALSAAATDPSDMVLAQRALDGAKDAARVIASAGSGVAQLRGDIESRLAGEAGRLSASLAAFEGINGRIVTGTRAGIDVTDLMDQRDALITSMSSIIGVTARTRGDNDMVLQTDGGAILFETRARTVAYWAAAPAMPGQPGGRFLVDGVVVAGPGAAMPSQTGTVRGLIDFRDVAALDFEGRMDETARQLITAFREVAAPGSGKPDITGLFTADGLPGLPPSGVRVPGLAANLKVSAGADPAQGGSLARLRDAGIGAPGDIDYKANTTGAAGFGGRLIAMSQAFDEVQPVDPAVGLGASRSVADLAARAFGAVEETRKAATERASFTSIVLQRSSEALASETGVSLDAEMTRLLELERSYAASAKIIGLVDQMHKTLFEAVR